MTKVSSLLIASAIVLSTVPAFAAKTVTAPAKATKEAACTHKAKAKSGVSKIKPVSPLKKVK